MPFQLNLDNTLRIPRKIWNDFNQAEPIQAELLKDYCYFIDQFVIINLNAPDQILEKITSDWIGVFYVHDIKEEIYAHRKEN